MFRRGLHIGGLAFVLSCGAAEVETPTEEVEFESSGGQGTGDGDPSTDPGDGDEMAPEPQPNPEPNPGPDPEPNPGPDPEPNPGPDPEPEPEPEPEPVAATQFLESDGYVVMEMESVPLTAALSWDMQADLSGFTGDGYYQFNGNGICNGDANSPLRFTFRVETEGRYELRLRAAKITHCVRWKDPSKHTEDTETSGCNHTEGTCNSLAFPTGDDCPDPTTQCRRTDISNDAFVQIRDANEEYVSFVAQPANTRGQGIKLFGGSSNAWAWTGRKALDVANEKWNAHWDLTPGVYTLIVEGRSQMFRIDRMVLFDEGRHNYNRNGFVELDETLSPP